MDMSVAYVWIAFIVFIGFQQWLRQQRRVLVHKERLTALEKGVALPPLEQETRRTAWNIERVLLLAGLCWISIGVTAFVVLRSLIGEPLLDINAGGPPLPIPPGLPWIGLAPIGIGLAHLAAYAVGRKKEKDQ